MCVGNFWMGGMWIFPAIMIIAILSAVYFIFGRENFNPPKSNPDHNHITPDNSESAMEILKKRYANGEIGKTKFEQMKKDIV